MAYGGSETELYSEVLAQVCLAFSMMHSRAMKASDLNENTISSLRSLIVTHRRANLNSKKHSFCYCFFCSLNSFFPRNPHKMTPR